MIDSALCLDHLIADTSFDYQFITAFDDLHGKLVSLTITNLNKELTHSVASSNLFKHPTISLVPVLQSFSNIVQTLSQPFQVGLNLASCSFPYHP